MPIVSLAGVDAAGGTLISAGQSFVKCKGSLIIVLHDPVAPHGSPPHDNAHVSGCSSTVRIKGLGVARAGDPADCGHRCSGSSNISVGQ